MNISSGHTVTVKELREWLEDLDEDSFVYANCFRSGLKPILNVSAGMFINGRKVPKGFIDIGVDDSADAVIDDEAYGT